MSQSPSLGKTYIKPEFFGPANTKIPEQIHYFIEFYPIFLVNKVLEKLSKINMLKKQIETG